MKKRFTLGLAVVAVVVAAVAVMQPAAATHEGTCFAEQDNGDGTTSWVPYASYPTWPAGSQAECEAWGGMWQQGGPHPSFSANGKVEAESISGTDTGSWYVVTNSGASGGYAMGCQGSTATTPCAPSTGPATSLTFRFSVSAPAQLRLIGPKYFAVQSWSVSVDGGTSEIGDVSTSSTMTWGNAFWGRSAVPAGEHLVQLKNRNRSTELLVDFLEVCFSGCTGPPPSSTTTTAPPATTTTTAPPPTTTTTRPTTTTAPPATTTTTAPATTTTSTSTTTTTVSSTTTTTAPGGGGGTTTTTAPAGDQPWHVCPVGWSGTPETGCHAPPDYQPGDPFQCPAGYSHPDDFAGFCLRDGEGSSGEESNCFSWNPISWFKGLPCFVRWVVIPPDSIFDELRGTWSDIDDRVPFSFLKVLWWPAEQVKVMRDAAWGARYEVSGTGQCFDLPTRPGGEQVSLICANEHAGDGIVGVPTYVREVLRLIVFGSLALGLWQLAVKVLS